MPTSQDVRSRRARLFLFALFGMVDANSARYKVKSSADLPLA
jgi:hypothetical protein